MAQPDKVSPARLATELSDQQFTAYQLRKILGRHQDFIEAALEGVPPEGSADNGKPTYAIKTFVDALDAKRESKSKTGKAVQDDIKAEMLADDLRLKRGELYTRADVRKFVTGQLKVCIELLSGVSSLVERDCDPDVLVIETIDIACEETQQKLYRACLALMDELDTDEEAEG